MPEDVSNTAIIEPDRFVVTGRPGAKMHLGQLRPRAFSNPGTDADTLCGRRLFGCHTYPLNEERFLPWDLCSRCAARRAGNGREVQS